MATLQVGKLKVAELKAELQSRGLATNGLKKDLAERLQAAIDAEGAPNEPDALARDGDTQDASAEVQDQPELPGPTEIVESAVEAPAPTDAETTVAIESKPVEPQVSAAPSEVVEPPPKEPEQEGGLQFSSAKDEAGTEGTVAVPKRKREDVSPPARPEKVEPPAVEEEEAMVPNDPVPPPPSEVAARMDKDAEPERKRAKLSPEPSTSKSFSIRGAAASRPSDSPSVETKESVSVTKDLPSVQSASIFISNLTRPCPDAELERMLSEYGEVRDLYLNKIKTHAIVTLDREGAAAAAIEALQGKIWPDGGRQLIFRSLPSDAAASELIRFDKAAGGRQRFILHIEPGSGIATLRTPTTVHSGVIPTGPRGLASSLPAALAAAEPVSSRAPVAPASGRSDASAAVPSPVATQQLHRPGPKGGLTAHFKRTIAHPQIYYRENDRSRR